MRSSLRSVLIGTTLLVAWSLCIPAHAALPLTVELDPSSQLTRSQGPVPVTLKLDWAGPGLLEGRLHLNVVGDHDLFARVVTDELYLNEGTHRYQVMLPAFSSFSSPSELTIRVTYVAGNERHAFPDSLLLRCPSTWQRRLVVGVIRGPGQMEEPLDRWLNALDVSTFGPPVARNPQNLGDESSVRLVIDDLEEAEVPVDPLRCCAFDVIVVHGPALSRLSRKQVAAILAWVKAGGSVVVIPSGRMETQHLEFLQVLDAGDLPQAKEWSGDDINQFLESLDAARLPQASNTRPAPPAIDTNGNLVIESPTQPRLRYVGLGRALLMDPGLLVEADLSRPEWREPIAFLWKTRHEQLGPIIKTGFWDSRKARERTRDTGQAAMQYGAFAQTVQRFPDELRLEPQPILGGAGMTRQLLPPVIRLVPFALIILILALYVLAIGPLDYWLLGRFRLRRFTWVWFPIMTLLFTALGIWLSNMFMGSSNHRRAVAIRDVDADGSLLRESRFEMLFNSRADDVTTDVRRALVMPLDYQSFFWNDMWTYANRSMQTGVELVGPPTITGRVPVQGTMVQHLPQWTPQLNRLMTIPLADDEETSPGNAVAAFDWSLHFDPSNNTQREQLRDRVKMAFGPDARIYLYHGDRRYTLAGEPFLFSNPSQTFLTMNAPPAPGMPMPAPGMEIPLTGGDFLQSISVRNQAGWFAYMSQVSPGCGPFLEDLAVLDASDPAQCLLLVAVDEGNDTIVYRRVYRGLSTQDKTP